MHFTLDDLATAASATVTGIDHPSDGPVIERMVIDSRTARRGDLFIAVVAERDGHDFARAAVESGAVAVLASRPVEVGAPVLSVADTVDALTEFGRLARRRLPDPVIGVTGSVGKTSTKDLLAAICAEVGPTTASERSLNNEMGVPLTLVNAAPNTERTVVEMGARGIGHIAHLCGIARPTHAVVTAVGMAHTELFGSIDGVAAAKGELVEALPASGTAVLNADDPRVAAMASRTAASVLTYGEAGDLRASGVELGSDLRARFTLHSPWGTVPVQLGVSGLHNVANALGAAGAALSCGATLDHVVAGLATASLSPSRMAVQRLGLGGLVIDDAYNANPTSMRAALDSLAALEADRRVAVVGYMAELGDDAAREHRAVAAHARSLGVEVVAVGTDLYGVEPLADVEAAIAALEPPRAGEAVLLKASRVVGLDRIAAAWLG